MLKAKSLSCLLFVALFSFTVRPGFGQTNAGTIIGCLTGSSGGVLRGVVVTASNHEKVFHAGTVSDEQFSYRLFYLAPAKYKLVFEKPGFSRLERDNLELRSNDALTVDIMTKVGSVVENVQVQSTAPMLETANATTGTLLSGTQMNALPIMQRYTFRL